jgi:hypothetical protein
MMDEPLSLAILLRVYFLIFDDFSTFVALFGFV